MAHNWRKYLGWPKPEVGTVTRRYHGLGPKRRHTGAQPIEKPKQGEVDLNSASVGELVRMLDKETREYGRETRKGTQLRGALNKALDVEEGRTISKEEARLIRVAVNQVWATPHGAKRRVIRRAALALRRTNREAIRAAKLFLFVGR